MDALDALLADLTPKPRAVSPTEAGALPARCALLREEPVLGGEPLRLFACGARLVALEVDDRGRPLLRAWQGREAAEAWFEQRLAAYERLWDG